MWHYNFYEGISLNVAYFCSHAPKISWFSYYILNKMHIISNAKWVVKQNAKKATYLNAYSTFRQIVQEDM